MFNIYFLNIYTNYLNNIRNTQSDIKFGYSTDISYAVRKWYNNDNYSLIVIIRNIQSIFGQEGRWKEL